MFTVPTKKMHVIMYRDNDARTLEGMGWHAYSFDNKEEADDMETDLRSSESVWGNEAVVIVRTTAMIPVTELVGV